MHASGLGKLRGCMGLQSMTAMSMHMHMHMHMYMHSPNAVHASPELPSPTQDMQTQSIYLRLRSRGA